MALAAVLATGRGRRPRKLVTVHGVPDEDYRLAARMLRMLAQDTVACGPGVGARLRAHGLEARLIANGCTAPPPALSREAIEREFPATRGRALVVGVGRLAVAKNFRATIRAIGLLPDAVLVIAGDGPERAALVGEARRIGVQARVILAGHRPDARALMGTADVVVISSHWEGLPLVAIEAMMAGTPIVAARAPWQDDFLRDGYDCSLVPHDDAQAMARAVARLLAEPARARQMADNARRTSAPYSADATVDAYLDLYRSLAPATA
jgi:glycosyltransferase involved in cell wall biosynthesis